MLQKRRNEFDIRQKRYSNARIKARNFLANTVSSQLNKEDCNNRAFICDLFVLLAQNIIFSHWKGNFKVCITDRLCNLYGKNV